MISIKKVFFRVLYTVLFLFIINPITKADLVSQALTDAKELAKAWIIVDNSDNPEAYNIHSSITRREMLKIMLKLAWVSPENGCEGKFTDLSKDDWGCKYAEAALKLWYVASNKYFRPDDSVSQVESLKMIFKARSIEVQKTDDWRVWYVQKSSELGYTKNFTNYDSKALRSFVFSVWAKAISKKIDEQILSYDKQKIELVFTWSMNMTSVLSNLKINPDIKYTSNIIDDKNLELTIDTLLTKDTNLIVNVWKNALTADWEKLGTTYVKQFKIDWNSTVDFVTPNWNITDLNQEITVRFSKPMVSLTNLDNQKKCPIEITPNLPWKCVWITTSTFQYRPENNFSMWWNYKIIIPAWIETISWDKTINSKTFTITTPEFKLLSNINSLKKDAKLKFAFNDVVSLDKFKANFSLSIILNDELDFSYYKEENDLEDSKNIISVFPKNWDWWYNKTMKYTISKKMTSLYWNIWLKSDITESITTNKLLSSYSPVVFVDENASDKYVWSNLIAWKNNKIITKTNPSVLLNFYEDVVLDKTLFSSSVPFELHYVKTVNYDNWKSILKEDKKQVLITFSGIIKDTLTFDLLLSKISSTQDMHIVFSTKQVNSIFDYKQINYKKACLTIKNDLDYYNTNIDSFVYDKFGSVIYTYKVGEYTGDSDCTYESWKNKYIVRTKLNPETNYKLTIKSNLLDTDNYPLDKDYNFSFSTPKALNEDKKVSIIDSRDLILTPSDVKPLTIWINSINISKADIKICVWDLDILSLNYLANSDCVSKTINLTNLWFKPNISIVDLEQIYSKEMTKKYITIEVSKIIEDKTSNETKYGYDISKSSIVISDISATINASKNSILWLHNYSNGADLTDKISKIESYTIQREYSNYWNKRLKKATFDKEISFVPKEKGLYELWSWNYSSLLITLKSWEQVILDSISSYYPESEDIYNYIYLDKPIYKASEKVNISWLSRILSAEWYSINTSSIDVSIRDSRWKEVFSKNITLNNLGTFEFSFDLPSDAKLWKYNIEIWYNNLDFLVEEYEKPDFEVKANSQKESYLYWESAKIDVKSDYYIGLPLANWEWKYKLNSSDFNFDWWKTTWYMFWEQNYFWWDYRSTSSDNSNNYEQEKSFILDNNWKNTIDIPLELKDKDKIYTLSTTITDSNTKKSISASTTFKAIRSNVFLWIKFDKYYYAYKNQAKIWFVATDIDGNKLSNKSFNLKVYKVDYSYNKSTYNYDTKEEIALEKSIQTNSSWIATDNFTFLKYGEYRFEISNWDYKTTKTIYVSGWDILRPIEAWNNIELTTDKDVYSLGDKWKIVISSPVTWVKALVTIEKLDKVLDYAIVNIDSNNQEMPFTVEKEYLPNFRVWVYIIKDVKTSKDALSKLEKIRGQMQVLEQKLQKEKIDYIQYLLYDLSIIQSNYDNIIDTGSLDKLVSLRLEERELLDKILPDYYIWNKDISVKTDSVKIKSKVYLDNESYLPWDSQYIELTLTDNDWNPINWKATVSIIDKSLLALKDNKNDIVEYFYSEKPIRINTLWNLSNLIKRIDFKIEADSELKEERNYASDDLLGDTLGSLDAEAPEEKSIKENWSSNPSMLRSDFKDVAFYKVNTNAVNWKVILEVPKLPDNLTTWVIDWYVFTDDSKVWNFKKEFKVQKDLAILPQVPRFFIDWDKSQIWALIVNNTSLQKNVQLSLDISWINIVWNNKKSITVSPNSSSLVNFDIEVWTWNLINLRTTDIILTAISWKLTDSVKVSKTIYPSKTSEYVFTNWSTKDLSYEEKVDFTDVSKLWGNLEISLWATILTNLTKNLDKTISYPGEDLSSKLTFLKNALALQNLYKSLGKSSDFDSITLQDYNSKYHKIWDLITDIKNDIINYKQEDNGLSYFKDCSSWWNYGSCSNMDTTGEYLNLNITVSWIDNKLLLDYYEKALISKIEENKKYSNNYTEINDFLPIALYRDADFINKYFSPNPNLSNLEKLDYIKIYELLWTSWDKTNDYIQDLKNSIYVEARGSVLPVNNWYNYNDNTVSSSKMSDLLMDKETDEKLFVENMVRFILSNRDENGDYYAYDFWSIVNTINKYVNYTHELQNVDFKADAYINSKSVMTSKFTESNKYTTDKKEFDFSGYLNEWENSLWFEKTWTWKLYYDVWVRYYLPVSEMPSRDEWITVLRNYYDYDDYKNAFKKQCFMPWWYYYSYSGYCFTQKVKNIDNINSATKWNLIIWEIQIVIDRERNDIVVNDYIPAWAEILNTDFDTTDNEVKDISWQDNNNWWSAWFDHVEQKETEVYLYAKHLSAWTYKYTYVLKASNSWIYNLKPATAELLNTPEIWWRSSWWVFEIK